MTVFACVRCDCGHSPHFVSAALHNVPPQPPAPTRMRVVESHTVTHAIPHGQFSDHVTTPIKHMCTQNAYANNLRTRQPPPPLQFRRCCHDATGDRSHGGGDGGGTAGVLAAARDRTGHAYLMPPANICVHMFYCSAVAYGGRGQRGENGVAVCTTQ